MDRERAEERIAFLEAELTIMRNVSVIGADISIPSLGVGTIKTQTAYITEVSFDGFDKVYDARIVHSSFFIDPELEQVRQELSTLKNKWSSIPSPDVLIKELIESWNSWDQYEEVYLNKIAYQLLDFPKVNVTDREYEILGQLKTQLSEEEWSRLPEHIADIHFGRKQSSPGKTSEEALRRRSYQRRLDHTIKLINQIMEYEFKQKEKEARKEKAEEARKKLPQLFDCHYLEAKTRLSQLGLDGFITDTEFNQRSEEYVDKWFDREINDNENKPDSEQIKAISTRRKNTEVIARAGSGKTTTIKNRARFLIQHCGVDPSTILMLAFNKNAVEEMEDKMLEAVGNESIPFIMTFHALAYSIVHPKETLIYDNPRTGIETLSQIIQSFIDDKIRDPDNGQVIRSLMMAQFREEWGRIEKGGFHLPKEEMLSFRRALRRETLHGEFVKTEEERALANTLFEHNVLYEHNPRKRRNNNSKTISTFFVNGPKGNTIVIDLTDNTFGLEDIRKQKNYWEGECGCNYYSINNEVVNNREEMIERLKRLCESAGILFYKLTEDELWKKVKERAIDRFTKSIVTFIGRCRKREIEPWKLEEMQRYHIPIKPEENLFISIARDIYEIYVQELESQSIEDFDGLMSTATSYVKSGRAVIRRNGKTGLLKDLTHILIDEYQDFSYLFDNFLKAIRCECPEASIFCVGDDWQAINAFAGSDVKFFLDFPKSYPASGQYYISTNYRSRTEIVNAGNCLMNDHSIRSFQGNGGRISLGYNDELQLFPDEEELFGKNHVFAAVVRLTQSFIRKGKTVAILSRTNDEIKKLQKDLPNLFAKSIRGKIFVSTVHKFKGEEKDAIIVLDAVEGKFPLINPNWFFYRILGDTEEKLIDDERRLFYVAITRAKEDLIILTTKKEESPFLKRLPIRDVVNWSYYPPFVGGELSSGIEQVKVIVSNQSGLLSYPPPTMLIKEKLKANGYKYNNDGSWYRFCQNKEGLISEIMQCEWALEARGIVIKIINQKEEIIAGCSIDSSGIQRMTKECD